MARNEGAVILSDLALFGLERQLKLAIIDPTRLASHLGESDLRDAKPRIKCNGNLPEVREFQSDDAFVIRFDQSSGGDIKALACPSRPRGYASDYIPWQLNPFQRWHERKRPGMEKE